MKYFGTLLLGIFFLPLAVQGAPLGAPAQSVWVSPDNATKGEEIELNAFLYNSTAKTATVTVLFTAGDTEIVTTVVTIAPQTAKVAIGPWQQPAVPTTVTASAVKALDASKKDIPELLGIIGTVEVGKDATTFNTEGIGNTLKSWFGRLIADIEPWRKKQAEHFSALREEKKLELDIKNIKGITDRFADKPAEAPATEPTMSNYIDRHSDIPIVAYITLLYATAFATLCSSIALFYITGVLLGLFVLRFIFGIFRG